MEREKSAPIRWDKGGEGVVVRADKDLVELRSSIPSAPGSRLTGALESGTAVRVKVARCRRTEAGGDLIFLIEGRLLDATRGSMAEIAALADADQAP
ncbi:MAG TPA: hypothetical protein VK459_24195 [Polyangiaceae bacterium]|jgi:hypothetical protein|nr:hypothetical protein [Polyangiaceae bacterium]